MTIDGLVRKQGLAEEELNQINNLASLCDQFEQIQLKINRDMLRNRPTNETNDFLYYRNGELIGFLGIYVFRSTEAEVSGMVHPDYRRQGIFRSLVSEAVQECKQRELPKIIFICHNRSQSGKHFVDALGATYSFSEYWMEWQEQENRTVQTANNISLRPASTEDAEVLMKLNMSGFNMTEGDAREYVSKTIDSSSDKTYIAILDDQPIGKISILADRENAFIFGFCVATEHQRRGYGRQILQLTIDRLLEKKPQKLALEVAVENKHALTLYQSCGFQETGANDYYEITL